ncbi:MAG: c-type cytochrome [Verrucomicrobiales bacterium]|nr:c-type cytochrome [Verrucomicrobiales bacterium]
MQILPFRRNFVSGRSALALFVGSFLGALSWPAATAQSLTGSVIAAGNLKAAKDFKVELLYIVPKEKEGSWVAMCTDPKGRLIVSDQHGKLYRIVPPGIGSGAPLRHEAIDLEIGKAHGLLYAFDSLYVMVNEDERRRGLYCVRDTNGDDRFDDVKLLRKLEGGGEHGVHAILLSPDGKSLHLVCGNMTKLTDYASSRVPLNWSEDHLLPRMWDGNGFMKGVLGPGGWIARTDPEGKNWELVAVGFRNEFDAAFNRHGELFAFDADMEWDLNTPWYRPTRLNHVISGAEFGWRSGAGKWPAYYVDSFGAVVNIGPGSPTGVTFGYGAKFPAKYQEAMFLCDWSFGKLYAVHLKPEGASYTGTAEEFVTGQPLALTDVVINPADGAMYFAVGGRKTQSALYRVTYTGKASTKPSKGDNRYAKERELRRKLESFHGHRDPRAVKEAWPYLGHKDRAIRYAARIALEWQDPAEWREKALHESNPRQAIMALAALARVSNKDEFHRKPADPKPDPTLQARMLDALDRFDWARLTSNDRLEVLRAYSLVFTRLGRPEAAARERLIGKFDPLFPAPTRELNAELAAMMVYLDAPGAATKLMAAFRSAPTQEEQLDYARSLRVLKAGWTQPLREEYFRWFLKAANFKGGASLAGFMRDMKKDAMATLSEAEMTALKPILEAKPEKKSPHEMLLASRPVVKEWTLAELAPIVERGVKSGRSYDRGRKLFGEAGCAACHRFDNDGASVGPDLTNVAGRFSVRDLLESTVEPSKSISDQYGAIVIRKKDGETVVGRVGNLSGDVLMVIENMFAPNDFANVKRQDVEAIEPSKVSMMPEGLLNSLKEDEILDLTAFLLSRGDRNNKMFRSVTAYR